MKPSSVTAGGVAGAWRSAGSRAATPSMPAAGIPCHDVATRPAGDPPRAMGHDWRSLAPDLAALVDADRRANPCRPQGLPRRPEREPARRIDRALRHRHRPLDDPDQADHLSHLSVPADHFAPRSGGAATHCSPAVRATKEVQEGSAAPQPGNHEALQGAQHQSAGADERLPAGADPVPHPDRALLRHSGRPPEPADPRFPLPGHLSRQDRFATRPVCCIAHPSAHPRRSHDLRADQDHDPARPGSRPDPGVDDAAHDADHAGLHRVHLTQLRGRPRALLGGQQPLQHRPAILHHRLGFTQHTAGLTQGESRMSTTSDSVETTGSTVEEAVEKALEELEEARENVEIMVLDESPQEARVRVTVRETYAVKARQVVAELLYKMGITAQVFIKKADDPVMIDVAGDNLGLLIGWRGETLRAFQTVVNLILNEGRVDRRRLVVDVDHYRERRAGYREGEGGGGGETP